MNLSTAKILIAAKWPSPDQRRTGTTRLNSLQGTKPRGPGFLARAFAALLAVSGRTRMIARRNG